ncbi:MAG: 30S ribosomal protein S12 methylthiotransferase RimO [Clostridiaceae bacterium]|nr:30S ribosomal protein S12 methylthiotransferase RimO [Clostridiaceae bacterium]
MSLKAAIVSLGCSKNLIDSEVMVKSILNNDYEVTNDAKAAEVIIINTCGFIESAKQESIDTILEMSGYKKNGKCKVLIASGCLAERYKEELMKELPELDAVIGTGDYKDIAEVIRQALRGEKVILYGHQETVDINKLERRISAFGASSYLKIAEGCDNRCSFCIIPALRGRYRSRPMEDILEEARELSKNGIKELIIIAQDITRYGIDLYHSFKLSELLRELAKIEGIEWIRLLYSYPDEFSDELIEVIAKEDKICKYLDIPIQHASNAILRKMGRKSSKEKVIELIEKLRARMPDIVLRTTLIVGFPGETGKDFKELYDFVSEMKFNRLGVFTYSREEDTKAYDMPGQVEEAVKQERLEKIMLLQKHISLEHNKKLVGKTLEVLIEGFSEGEYFGRSCMDAPEIDGRVYFKSDKALIPGDFCHIAIKKAYEYDLVGERIDEYRK